MSDNSDDQFPAFLEGVVYKVIEPVTKSIKDEFNFDSLSDECGEYSPKIEKEKKLFLPQYQIFNDKPYRTFSDWDEAVQYAEDKWKSSWDSMPQNLKDLVCCYESRGRRMNSRDDRYVIRSANKALPMFAPFEDDVILYRGGKDEDFDGNRPFLATSFLKRTAESFAEKYNGQVYTILVHKGTRAIPLCAQGDIGFQAEQEVLIKTEWLHCDGSICEYYN